MMWKNGHRLHLMGKHIIWQGLQLFQLANKKIMRYVFIQNLYMTNVLCSSDMQVKTSQSQTAQLIELVADIMLPLVYREEDKKFYEFILESRQILIEQGQKNKGKDKYRENMILNVEYAFAFENREHYMKKENKEVTFCMDEFWAFGMATEIARIMNTTRQNIDRYISSGKIKESRTMDKAIFELLGEDIW